MANEGRVAVPDCAYLIQNMLSALEGAYPGLSAPTYFRELFTLRGCDGVPVTAWNPAYKETKEDHARALSTLISVAPMHRLEFVSLLTWPQWIQYQLYDHPWVLLRTSRLFGGNGNYMLGGVQAAMKNYKWEYRKE